MNSQEAFSVLYVPAGSALRSALCILAVLWSTRRCGRISGADSWRACLPAGVQAELRGGPQHHGVVLAEYQ
jgi:hypothetical protein